MNKDTIVNELAQFNEIYQLIVEFVINYSFQILGGLLILILGWIVGGKLGKLVLKLCESKNIDVTLSGFLASTVRVIVTAMFLIIALGKVGISIAPFVAALGAASLGIGLALQGPLSNYGAGVTLVITRPFVVGDTISVEDVNGIVKIVKLAYTVLEDEDGVEYTIPNKKIVGEIIANSHADTLIELSVDISYSDNIDKACKSIADSINLLPLRSEQREACVGIESFADSGITLGVRFWAPTSKQYEAKYAANHAIFEALEKASITIPFPQREVRTLNAV